MIEHTYLDCECRTCGELINQTFDCACDGGGCYCYAVCKECPMREKCDAWENPEQYPAFDDDDCAECDIKECQKYKSDKL